MRIVVQRVRHAKVIIEGKVTGSIGRGLLAFIAVHKNDDEKNCAKMAVKIGNLRIFPDHNDKMNLSVRDIEGGILVVSQFTLYGDCRRGNRPCFTESALPEQALKLYDCFIKILKADRLKVETGIFGANMDIEMVNEGPVTIIIDS